MLIRLLKSFWFWFQWAIRVIIPKCLSRAMAWTWSKWNKKSLVLISFNWSLMKTRQQLVHYLWLMIYYHSLRRLTSFKRQYNWLFIQSLQINHIHEWYKKFGCSFYRQIDKKGLLIRCYFSSSVFQRLPVSDGTTT